MTKKELEVQVKDLKNRIRELEKNEKSLDAELDNLTNIGYGVTLNNKNVFELIEIKFSDDLKKALITGSESVSKSVTAMMTKTQRTIGKQIVILNKGR